MSLELPALFESRLAGVRLAWADLDDPRRDPAELEALLSTDERERAARFRFEHDRLRYAAAHALLRGLLGQALGADPRALRFVTDPLGKPRLGFVDAGLEFNLSHTGGRALFGFARGIELGVDAERVDAARATADLAHDVFSPAELAEWQALAEAERTLGFFNGWTRKEAFVKALGRGLDYPLDAFTVSLAPGGEARLVSLAADASPASQWSIDAFSPEPGYVAAVVARLLQV